jgi:hypothetical protein
LRNLLSALTLEGSSMRSVSRWMASAMASNKMLYSALALLGLDVRRGSLPPTVRENT